MSTSTYRARLARKQADRAIKVYEKELTRTNLSERQRNEVKGRITELKRAANATRKRAKSGRLYKTRTDEKIDNATAVLNELSSRAERTRVMQRGSVVRRNRIAESELFKALANEGSSIFSQREGKIFMSATKEAWQNVPAGEDRIRAIMDFYNQTDLREFIQTTLEMRKKIAKSAVNPAADLTEEQKAALEGEMDVTAEPPSPETEQQELRKQLRTQFSGIELSREELETQG